MQEHTAATFHRSFLMIGHVSLGTADEGPAGPRGENFYAGYFRNPDGNKLNFFCMS